MFPTWIYVQILTIPTALSYLVEPYGVSAIQNSYPNVTSGLWFCAAREHFPNAVSRVGALDFSSLPVCQHRHQSKNSCCKHLEKKTHPFKFKQRGFVTRPAHACSRSWASILAPTSSQTALVPKLMIPLEMLRVVVRQQWSRWWRIVLGIPTLTTCFGHNKLLSTTITCK